MFIFEESGRVKLQTFSNPKNFSIMPKEVDENTFQILLFTNEKCNGVLVFEVGNQIVAIDIESPKWDKVKINPKFNIDDSNVSESDVEKGESIECLVAIEGTN
jgi:hypothetical protein